MRSTLLLLALAALLAGARAKIYLYKAGHGRVRIRQLRHGSCIPNGFTTVWATFSRWPGKVHVYVNGRYKRTETKAPYTINGDNNGFGFRWVMPSWKTSILFKSEFAGSQHVTVFRCARRLPVRRPAPVWKPKPVWKPRKPVWKPKRPVWKPSKPVWRPKPVWQKPKPRPVWQPRAVWKPHGHRAGPLRPNRKWCVVMPFFKVVRPIARGWELQKKGLAYEPWNNYGGVYRPGRADLKFRFRVPRKGRYAVLVDMTTKHWTEHNDIWLKFRLGQRGGPQDGFVLRNRFGQRRGIGFAKAYHNKNGRAVEAFSVDNNPHTFSTKAVLYPGITYTMHVGARSTKIWVHRIIMFPCGPKGCDHNTMYWRNFRNTCKAVW